MKLDSVTSNYKTRPGIPSKLMPVLPLTGRN